jgi:hypothetical protein
MSDAPSVSPLITGVFTISGVVIGFILTWIKDQIYLAKAHQEWRKNKRQDILLECLKLAEELRALRYKSGASVPVDKDTYDAAIKVLASMRPWLLMLRLYCPYKLQKSVSKLVDKVAELLNSVVNDFPPAYRRLPADRLRTLADELQQTLIGLAQEELKGLGSGEQEEWLIRVKGYCENKVWPFFGAIVGKMRSMLK